ncbi:MAG: C25 family cysteine peptidase, partial [Fidelibacterota bacterium]
HGSSTVWTQERVLTLERDINLIDTGMKLPLWIAATCDWGRFDDLSTQGMAEHLMVKEENGAIAIISATRGVYGKPNVKFNRRIFNNLFKTTTYSMKSQRIGLALMTSKTLSRNDQKFILLGDPTLRLKNPWYASKFTSISPEIFKALSHVNFEGKIVDTTGKGWKNFSGIANIMAFDSERRVTRTEGTASLSYWLPGSRIFTGPVEVKDSTFSGGFIIPRDILYQGNRGKMISYFWNENLGVDGVGYKGSIIFEGTATGIVDEKGPVIEIGFKGQQFRSGDMVRDGSILLVYLEDESGINITGEVGHNISLIIDEDTRNRIDLTEFFVYELGSYQSGYAEYEMPSLSPGIHTLELKAWDNYNNFSVKNVELTVISSEKLSIERVYNFPNPTRGETYFTFYLSKPADEVVIRIYTVAGRLIKVIKDFDNYMVGFNRIPWDGRDEDGDIPANGVYLYTLTVKSSDGNEKAEVIGKLAIAR